MLDIEVEEFPVMFKKRSTDILEMEKLPSGFLNFHETLCYNNEYGNKEDREVQPINDPTAKKLLGMGLIAGTEIERSDKNITEHLSELLADDLKKMCEKYGFKKSQNKQGLVQLLMEVKEKISIPPIAEPTPTYNELMEKLSQAYISDIEKQLSNKPDDYAAFVWDIVASDCIELMPMSGKKLIHAIAEKYQHLFDK
jgi:hypothetical protein